MIAAKSPIREKIAGLSSSLTYYPTRGAAIRCIETILNGSGLGLADTYHNLPCTNDGRTTIGIVQLGAQWESTEIGLVVFCWHRMELSGMWEIVTYVA